MKGARQLRQQKVIVVRSVRGKKERLATQPIVGAPSNLIQFAQKQGAV